MISCGIFITLICSIATLLKNWSCYQNIAPVLHWYVDDGCHTEDQWGKPGKKADDYLGTFQPEPFGAGVRCCSDDGTTCKTIGKCPGTSTHSEAEQVCNENGMRLCTKNELLTEICCETGGNCDNHPVWTSTSLTYTCQVNGNTVLRNDALKCKCFRTITDSPK